MLAGGSTASKAEVGASGDEAMRRRGELFGRVRGDHLKRGGVVPTIVVVSAAMRALVAARLAAQHRCKTDMLDHCATPLVA